METWNLHFSLKKVDNFQQQVRCAAETPLTQQQAGSPVHTKDVQLCTSVQS